MPANGMRAEEFLAKGTEAEQMGRSRRWLLAYPRAVPVAIFLLVGAITALSVFAMERFQNERSHAQLRADMAMVGSSLERRASTTSAYLRAGASLFSTLGDVPPDRFRSFVTELRLDAAYSGTDGVGWAARVDPPNVQAFEAATSDSLGADFAVRPQLSPDQPYAIPVTFLQPPTVRNRRALGYDMFSEPVRREAMVEAERNARPTATGKVVLAQEDSASESGFLVYMPVFGAGTQARELKGFIYSPINARQFLEASLDTEANAPRNFGMRLYDRSASPENLLASAGPQEASGEQARLTINIANRPWVLEVQAYRTNILSQLSLVTLVFGLLVASLLMLLTRILTKQALEDARTLAWLEEQGSIRNSLTRELNHRVKNTLANVLSIIALTRRRAENVDEFATGLDGRIRALSATHDLLTRSDWGLTPLRDVIEAELAPYVRSQDHTVQVQGPDIRLAPSDALSLGLAIHELATNAAKFGALSQPGGRLDISWTPIADSLARVQWVESNGPPVPQERKTGFGTDLLERIVAHELKNPIDLEFAPSGVRCTMVIPLREPAEFRIRDKRR